VVEHFGKSIRVHILTDEDDLLAAITIVTFPNSFDMGTVFRPLRAGNRGPEVARVLVTASRSGL
jgi:hypothetical protein